MSDITTKPQFAVTVTFTVACDSQQDAEDCVDSLIEHAIENTDTWIDAKVEDIDWSFE